MSKLVECLMRYGLFLHSMTRRQWLDLGLSWQERKTLRWYRENAGMYSLKPIGFVRNGREAVIAAGIPNDNREHLRLICMDEDYRLLAVSNIAIGSSVGMNVCKQNILMDCCLARPTKAVLVHNHELGGDVSDEDYRFTVEVQELLNLAQIELIDHYVRKSGEVVSVLTNQVEKL